MKQTENLKLNKIELTDSADITVINPNWDSIDNEITKIKTNKADTSYVNETVATQLGGKVDKETGKGLSTNDFTTAEKTKLNGITANATKTEASSTNGKIKINGIETTVYTHPSGTNPHGTTKADVGLGNVDNTSDASKPISRATQSALDEKAPLSHVLDVDIHITPEEREAWNKGGTPDLATPTADGIMSKEDKSKLDGVELGANNYTHPNTHPASMITGLVGKTYPNSTLGEVFNDYGTNVASGAKSHAEGGNNKALGETSHVEGQNAVASGIASHAEGFGSKADGKYSHAEGFNSRAKGESSHAEGYDTVALGEKSHTEGEKTTASGESSHAEGFSSNLADMNNVALSGDDADKAYDYWIEFEDENNDDDGGKFSISWGHASHCEGYDTATFGVASHAEGCKTVAKGDCSHAEGGINIASGMCSHVEGIINEAKGDYSHAEGYGTKAEGESAHTEGSSNIASGESSHAEGSGNVASGESSHAEGCFTEASGSCSHAEGKNTASSGDYSHAEGYASEAEGNYSHAEGYNVYAIGEGSHAEGYANIAKGDYSHAEGYKTKADGDCSHAEGYMTKANSKYSHAEGYTSEAKGDYSHAEGRNTTADTYGVHAQGQYNVAYTGSKTSFTVTQNAFIIGNGTAYSNKSNAFRVTFDGKSYGLSAFNSTGADYAEYFEWKDGNPDNEDRIGLFVTLDGDKIRIANPDDDYIVGIISGNQSIIGNACEDSWNDMYIRDEFDRLQYEDVEVEKEESVFNKETGEMETKTKTVTEKHIKLNPNYDSNMEYLPRSQRKEWGVVGMLGQIKVRDDGTCTPNGYCSVGENGTATKSDSGYRVLKRINESIVLVLFR